MDKARRIAIAKEIAIWIPTLLLAQIFFTQGISKFSDNSGWVSAFRTWGYPDWFRMSVGAAEFAGAALLPWRRTAPVGALVILCVMVGAMATHVFIAHRPRDVFHEAVPVVLSTIVLLARREQLRRLLARGSTSPAMPRAS